MSGPGRPAGARPGASRRVLLDAACAQFAEHGYAATTTRGIAEAAGMQAANLRHHLGSKAEVFAAVYDDGAARLAVLLGGLLGRADAVTPGDHLRLLGALVAEAPEVVRFMVRAPLERARHPELQVPLGEGAIGLEALVRGTVRDWAARGRLRHGVDPDVLTDVLIAATFGTVLYGSAVDPTVDLTAAVDVLARLVDGDVWT
ncbi:MAG: TetR/AcrR family transcriptional regulator [Microthrixaceae bacterium]